MSQDELDELVAEGVIEQVAADPRRRGSSSSRHGCTLRAPPRSPRVTPLLRSRSATTRSASRSRRTCAVGGIASPRAKAITRALVATRSPRSTTLASKSTWRHSTSYVSYGTNPNTTRCCWAPKMWRMHLPWPTRSSKPSKGTCRAQLFIPGVFCRPWRGRRATRLSRSPTRRQASTSSPPTTRSAAHADRFRGQVRGGSGCPRARGLQPRSREDHLSRADRSGARTTSSCPGPRPPRATATTGSPTRTGSSSKASATAPSSTFRSRRRSLSWASPR